jgi:hypothetical protein
MVPNRYRTTDEISSGGDAVAGRAKRRDQGDRDATTDASDSGAAASVLDVTGFLTASDETGLWQARIAAENPTDRPMTAAFAATVSPVEGEEIRSTPVERTVPAGERERFRLDLVDPAAVRFDRLTAVVFEGFRLRISANGVPVPDAAPDAGGGPRIDPTDDGCAYPFGLDETHLAVEYAGEWDGVVGVDGDQRSIDRRVDFGAPDGYDTSYVRVDGDADVVTANAQKRDGGDDPLTMRIVRRGRVLDEMTTTSGYGVAVVGATLGGR